MILARRGQSPDAGRATTRRDEAVNDIQLTCNALDMSVPLRVRVCLLASLREAVCCLNAVCAFDHIN